MQHVDVAIVGGGLVGASLACALTDVGLRVILLEKLIPSQKITADYDARSLALSSSSVHIFKQLGLWSSLQPHASAIRKIHVSERGGFGVTRLSAQEAGVDALGYVVEAQYINKTLWEKLATQSSLTVVAPATVTALHVGDQHAILTINANNKPQTISAALVIAADGMQSFIREQLHISVEKRDYHQTAIIAHVTPSAKGHGVAYERFTPTGPLALLPLSSARYGVVWTVPPDMVEDLLALTDAEFLTHLQQAFGYRLGHFMRVGKRQTFPLSLQQAREQIRERVVLLGSAAHHLHPVAGQGFNLALRDVALLAATLQQAREEQQDIGALVVLKKYLAARVPEQQRVLRATDGLVRLFSNDKKSLRLLRQVGLLAFDQLGSLKHTVMRHAMGLTTQLPKP